MLAHELGVLNLVTVTGHWFHTAGCQLSYTEEDLQKWVDEVRKGFGFQVTLGLSWGVGCHIVRLHTLSPTMMDIFI